MIELVPARVTLATLNPTKRPSENIYRRIEQFSRNCREAQYRQDYPRDIGPRDNFDDIVVNLYIPGISKLILIIISTHYSIY